MGADWSEFGAKLVKPIASGQEQPALVPRQRKSLPTGREGPTPRLELDGDQGEITSRPVEGALSSEDEILAQWDLDPAEWEIVGPLRRSSWEQRTADGEVHVLNSFRARIQRRRVGGVDVEALMAEIRDADPASYPTGESDGEVAFLHCAGDTQVGKEGTEATIARFMRSLHDGPARLAQLRTQGVPIGPVFLPWLGDCIEHVTGSYAGQEFSVELSLTEQIRVVRRLMLRQIQTYAPLTHRLVVPVVPGNHEIAVRQGGKLSTNVGDSFAIEIAAQVADILAENPAYSHVTLAVPEKNSLALALDICGTPVGMIHGHQARGSDISKWWSGQAHGCQPIGDTTLLLYGHWHHLKVQREGHKTSIQIPQLDSGSPWWTNSTGQDSPPGMVTMVVGGGRWGHLEII